MVRRAQFTRVGIGLVAILGLSACAEYVWRKPGASQQEFNATRYQCQMQSTSAAPVVNRPVGETTTVTRTKRGVYNSTSVNYADVNSGTRDDLFHSCMVAHGWRLVDANAPVVVPPSQMVSRPPAPPPGAPPAPPPVVAVPRSASPASAGNACQAGARVFAWSEDAWWAATVQSVAGGGECVVRYDPAEGKEAKVDHETVAANGLIPWQPDGPGQPLAQCRQGDKVLALSDGGWYRATIKQSRAVGAPCPTHYDGYGADEDEDLPLRRLRRIDRG